MYHAFSVHTKFDAVLYHWCFIINPQSVYVPNIANRNLTYTCNLRVLSEAMSSRKIGNYCAVDCSGGFRGWFLEAQSPPLLIHKTAEENCSGTRELSSHLYWEDKYQYLYFKDRVLMSKSLKYMGGILVLSESSQNHVVNCEEMRLAKYWV